jgi:hypothetical protein
MANEISLTAKLSVSKGSVSIANAISTKTQSMASTTGFGGGAADDMCHHTQNVGTTREAIDLVDVDNTNATGGEYILLLYNRDATNYVTVEVQTGAASYWTVGIMRPGESWGPNRLPKLDGSGYGGVFCDADTAACRVEVLACEAGDPAA